MQQKLLKLVTIFDQPIRTASKVLPSKYVTTEAIICSRFKKESHQNLNILESIK
jgi:hypothetical protein